MRLAMVQSKHNGLFENSYYHLGGFFETSLQHNRFDDFSGMMVFGKFFVTHQKLESPNLLWGEY